MNYQGDFSCGSVVYIYFNTFTSDDPSASSTITNFANTDVHIHKNDSLTQRNNAAGVAIDIDVDGITGSHFISIDTADNTVADFFVGGADYFVRIEGTTVDAATINAVVGSFSLENRHVAGIMAKTTIATLASQTSFTLTAASADDDAYNGCTAIVTDQVTAIQKCFGHVSDYTGSTRTVTLAADPGIFTMAAGDNINIIATSALVLVDAEAILADTEAATGVITDTEAILADTEAATAVLTDTEAILTDSEAILVDTEAATAVLTDTEAILTDTEAVLADTEAAIPVLTDTEAILVDTEAAVNLTANAVWDEAMVETTGAPAITGTFRAAIEWMFALSRNKVTQTATTTTLRNDADGADLATSTVSDDATTYTRGEWST